MRTLILLGALAPVAAWTAADTAPTPATTAQVINAGIGGHNTRNLLARVDRDVLAHRPDVVVLMVGTNDVLNHSNAVPLAEYRTNLQQLVKRIGDTGAHVVMMTIPPCYEPHLLTRHPAEFYGTDGPTGVVRQANEAVRAVAQESGAVLVDLNVLFTVLGEIGPGAGCVLRNEANSKSADGVHPTATGYRLIATAVFEAIQAARLPHTKIVCFGDSITFGANMDGAGKVEGDTYPGYLARLLAAES